MVSSKIEQWQVLIVGAGPSGLMMAHELTRFGISCVIIEKDLQKSPYSRAVGVQIRTLEIFKSLGLYDKLSEKSWAVCGAEIYTESGKPISIDLLGTTSTFSMPLIIDQPHTETVLEGSLHHLGQQVLRGVMLTDIAPDTDGVLATFTYPDGRIESKKFSYVIGADGAHSIVRKSMTNQFLGTTYDDAFILADAECIHPLDHDRFRIFFHKKHFLALIPMFGKNHYRLISVRRGERKKEGLAPTIDEFRQIAKQVIPYPFEIKNPVWVSRFFVQCRSASAYQEGRLFLVGDSAHIHSPAGGQGMNTGLQDAFNLAWKLAMVIKGMAKPALLDTYHPERKPVGDFLIDRTDRLFKFMVKSSIWARLIRRFVLPRFAKNPALIAKLATIASQTSIRYESGALCEHSEHLAVAGVRVGVRIKNLNLISSHLKKTDIHTLVSSLGISVLFFMPKNVGKKPVKGALSAVQYIHEQLGQSVNCHLVFLSDFDAEKSVNEEDYLVAANDSLSADEPYFVAIRPDHHVYCLGPVKDAHDLVKSLKIFLNHRGSR
jgi:2-polyprenyl-6-methoxyphenol hydroxylase-like FAD-dependent oxidoreductase